ncbi:MAG: hemolysin family protein [Acidimicrobiia bacterium]|nr:hemolysin family protein [Acidimicrobiia bacterium]
MTGVDEVWPQLILIVVLVGINALLSGAEIALISLREPQLVRMEESSSTGKIVADLARQPNRFLATIQIGITLAGFMASAVAAVSLAQPLLPVFGWAGGADETVAIITVTLILSYLTLVFGELAPKRLALQNSEQWALALGRPLHWFSVVMKPFVWLLSVSTDAVVRLFGGEPGTSREQVDVEELRDMIMASGRLDDQHQEVLLGAFEIAERTVVEVMTPRPDVRSIDRSATVEATIAEMDASGFSRLPVTDTGGGLDTAEGVIALQDLIGEPSAGLIAPLMKEPPVFPESLPVLIALRRLQQARQQLAFVVDEYGGIEGIVTVEDLVEELVGEIYDEFDRDVATVVHEPDGSYIVPGRFPVHDLVDLGIEVPEGEYTTVGGLVLGAFGRVPEADERFAVPGWEVTVLDVEGNAVTDVRFEPARTS